MPLSGLLRYHAYALSAMVRLQDIVTRYASQTGHHVQRRFGWDCHGLPVEYEIDKKLGACASLRGLVADPTVVVTNCYHPSRQ